MSSPLILLNPYKRPRMASGGGGEGFTLEGDRYTINGSDFPSRSQTLPLWFDNFADASNGAPVPGRAPIHRRTSASAWGWTQGGVATQPTFSNSNQRISGKNHTRANLTSSAWNASPRIAHPFAGAGVTDVCLMMWYFLSYAGGVPSNSKPFIWYGNSTINSDVPEHYLGWGGTGDEQLRSSYQDDVGGGAYNTDPVLYVTGMNLSTIAGRWIKIKNFVRQSSAGTGTQGSGPQDGGHYLEIDDPDRPGGPVRYRGSRPTMRTRDTAFVYDAVDIAGFMSLSGGATGMMCADDIYLDDQPMAPRVVFTDSADYDASTFDESQPSDIWSPTQISGIANFGRFSPGSTIHSHIVTGAGHSGFGSAVYCGSLVR